MISLLVSRVLPIVCIFFGAIYLNHHKNVTYVLYQVFWIIDEVEPDFHITDSAPGIVSSISVMPN